MRSLLHIADIPRRVLALSVLISTLIVVGCAGSSQNSGSTPVTQTPPTTPPTYTIGGTISGLFGTGLVLQDNGGNNLSVGAGATSFTFSTAIASGGAYSVKVLYVPANPLQNCTVSGGSGTVGSANVTSVAVSCVDLYTIGGTISGLSGMGLVLQLDGGPNIPVGPGATSFTSIPAYVASGRAYSITVLAQPSNPDQTCAVANGSGTVVNANVTSVAVSCFDSGFALTGSMTTARQGQTATLLNNGTVLIAGGGFLNAELYDPSRGTFTATGNMTIAYGQSATLLPNGQVLIAGGYGGTASTASAELYNPATGTFTATGSMTTGRELHTATLLNNGKVLIAGGDNGLFNSSNSTLQILSSAELYDPATGTFTATGSMTDARDFPTATMLNNGQVLIAGGEDDVYGDVVASAELYDPTTGTFTATGSMSDAREENTATLLNNGQVLIAGGDDGIGYLSSADLYDPTTGIFTATGSMTDTREQQTATLLNNGQVLIAGGMHSNTIASAELYDPAKGTFTATGSMTTARQDQTATLLNNGMVLVAGGLDFVSGNNVGHWASAELYNSGIFTPTGLVSIAVTPATPALSVGLTQQFVATGTFSDGSMQNLQSVTWSSSNQAACTITNDAGDHGVAFALAVGNCTITASAGSISGSAVLTVH